jgi:hypothetical protein
MGIIEEEFSQRHKDAKDTERRNKEILPRTNTNHHEQ